MALSPQHRAGLDRALKAIAEAEAGPTEADLTDAPVIDHWRPLRSGSRTIVLWGYVSGHPLLGRDTTTTSPLLAIDVEAGWARTKSRWYNLGRPFAALEAELAESIGVEWPAVDFIQFSLPGYLPLERPDQLPELLASYIAWVREFDAADRSASRREV
ncbi:ATP-dependent Lon protease (plasmid) [Paracoccus ferrooxidans]|nr:ATP-dependent Lon protease [Paracoccus ferrooxidans]